MNLDQLLDETRDAEPIDESFVQRVMVEVRTDEQRRSNRRLLRRPMVIGIAAAVVVTGGAVAAVVGTDPISHLADTDRGTSTHVTVRAPGESRDATTDPARSASTTSARAADDTRAATGHVTSVLDRKTGLKLETETYTNDFVVGRRQRVTMTLENTGKYPLSFNAGKGCALQAMALPAKGDGFEWMCAGSDADPREKGTDETFSLQPGERRSADAFLTIDRTGPWTIVGICRCSYAKTEASSLGMKNDPLSTLARRTLPAELLPERSDGKNLTTPPIYVRVR